MFAKSTTADFGPICFYPEGAGWCAGAAAGLTLARPTFRRFELRAQFDLITPRSLSDHFITGKYICIRTEIGVENLRGNDEIYSSFARHLFSYQLQ